MRPEGPHRVPDWTRYGPTDNQTVLRALSNDLQTIISKLTLPLGCVRRLDKRAKKVPHFTYTSAAGSDASPSILAGEDGPPAIVHCRAGKDRAGIIAALVLGIAGVPRETIVDDYSLTARYLIARHFDQHPDLSPEEYTWKDFQDANCHPATMELTRDYLDERHGGITGYLKDAGVTEKQLDAIRCAMTE